MATSCHYFSACNTNKHGMLPEVLKEVVRGVMSYDDPAKVLRAGHL